MPGPDPFDLDVVAGGDGDEGGVGTTTRPRPGADGSGAEGGAAAGEQPAARGWTGVSPRLAVLRRGVLVAFLVVASLACVAAALMAPEDLRTTLLLVPLASLALLAWGWWVIGRSVRAWGYTERERDLLVRHGVWRRQLVVVPYGRMQFVDVQAGPLERLADLASIQLHTAAAATDAHIPGLRPAEAARLRDRLASRGEAQSAGL